MNRWTKRWPVFILVMLTGGLLALSVNAQLRPSGDRPADMGKYLEKSVTLSFVLTGVAALDDCAAPLEFRETRKGSLQVLEIICPGGDEARFARLTFVRYLSETGRISLGPFRIEFLP